MKNLLLPIMLLATSSVFAQQSATTNDLATKTVKQGKYEVSLVNTDPTLDTAYTGRLIKTFFTVYPKLAAEYNKKTLQHVNFFIDTTYQGVAETDNGKVRFSSKWFHSHPEDIDVVTHEVMHIVQDYGETNGPGWLTEGIADYARYKFGINNEAAKWRLPDVKSGQSYENSYRITARFLEWLERKKKKGIVKLLDKKMREHKYDREIWQQQAGKSLQELWDEYIANPSL